jgi:hypothetical protein
VSRMSPSMAVALLALFVALGGTGYAAAKINGRDIRNRSIPGTKLRRNTLSGAEIRESRLGKVPAASDADFLAGRPAGAYLLAGTGVAGNSLRLGGKGASAFLPAGGTAANSALLGGQPASAFLPAAGTAADSAQLGGHAPSDFLAANGKAVDADRLDGKDATDFVAAGQVQGAGPVVIAMPGAGKTTRTLATNGPLSLVGECENSGGTPKARVTLQSSAEHFQVLTGETQGKAATTSSAATIAEAAASGGLPVWDYQRRSFTALTNPSAGALAGFQGTATAITNSGFGTNECYVAAWAFAS